MKLDYAKIKTALSQKAQNQGSEMKHIVDFLLDIVDNVKYDITNGNYPPEKAKEVLKQQLLGCLDELQESSVSLRDEITKLLK